MTRSPRVYVLLLFIAVLIGIAGTGWARGARTSEAAMSAYQDYRTLFLPLVVRATSLLPGNDPVVLAAGDTRSGCDPGEYQTLAILDRYPEDVVILHNGDFTNTGAYAEYTDCYDQTWGKHKLQTRPVPGNHEYNTASASGYFAYFGPLAAPQGQSYYSFDAGSWHIVALNTEIDASETSQQVAWLESDLAEHATLCTLAYWHNPRFSSGEHGDNTLVTALWQVLYAHHVELVLNGHDHDYERFAPQTPAGVLDNVNGIREFVVGTGGAPERPFSTVRANSEMRNDNSWGVLQLSLHPDRYEWEFVPVAGRTFSDFGTALCH